MTIVTITYCDNFLWSQQCHNNRTSVTQYHSLVEEGLPRLVVLHVLEVRDVPELDLGVVRDGGDELAAGADVEALDGVAAVGWVF